MVEFMKICSAFTFSDSCSSLRAGRICLICFSAVFIAAVASSSQVIKGFDYSERANVDRTFDTADADVFGQRFPSEHLTIAYEITGYKIIALTTSRHSNSTFYQTRPQRTSNGKWLLFNSSLLTGNEIILTPLHQEEHHN